MRSFFRIGLALQILLIVAASVAAYTGVIPTSFARVPHADLLGHAVGIGGLALFLDGVLGHRPILAGRGSLAALIVIAVAGVEEYLQRLSPLRSSSWSDFIADVIGVVFCVWLSRRLSATHAARAMAHA